MPKVSISQAIRLANVSRSHFYKKYVNSGVISIENIDGKKLIDTSELIRVFDKIQIENNSNTLDNAKNTYEKDKIISILESQVNDLKNQQEWLTQQIDELRKQQTLFLENKKRKKLFGIF